ncbi:SMP-30/gluconolactonase/LRE family protein [Sphingomonas sp.]|uniref:SMP-30/gluconolactonase/LRE family protein n=1 Tax=Sphingomonas sp. TaxID=28214 RepID=UPI002DD6925D|nr:SMP-30/gluconolactonase/LRE family protein [Sphingomonas sp.]
MSDPDEKLTGGANAVRRSLAVLRAVGQAGTDVTVAELAARLDLKKPTVHRLVSALIEEEFLQAESSPQRLRLGPVFLELAHSVWKDFDIRGAAAPELERLAAATGFSARLLTSSGDRMVCVEAAHPGERVRALDVGSMEPLRGSAAGRAISAFSSDGPADPDPEEALTKARYYAIDDDDPQSPWRSVAAPVFDERREPTAALVVTGPAHLLTRERLHGFAPHLLEAARKTSRAAGGYPFAISPDEPGTAGRAAAVSPLTRTTNLIGDSPVWVGDDDTLYWIDILAPAILRLDAGGATRSLAMPDVIGALVPGLDGRLTAAFSDSIAVFDPSTDTLGDRMRVDGVHFGYRFNDGAIDRRGRLWLGCADPSREGAHGRLLQVDPDGAVRAELSGLGLPNGLVWSAAGDRVYLIDSAMRQLRAYGYDERHGRFGDFDVLHQFPAGGPRPAGLAMSPDGNLWTAIWDGWELVELAPDGAVLDRVGLPVPRPSGLRFSRDGARLIVTTASVRLSPGQLQRAPLSGSVLSCRL